MGRSADLISLPIDDALPAVIDALRAHGACVVVAAPGAGKTTRVPPAVLDAGLARLAGGEGGRVVMLQPRRVAARAAAHRIASERGVSLGDEVGYRIRFENRTSAKTRIEVVTEGLLTRRLQTDPFLEGVGCVILDEFHERSLHADLGLSLLDDVRCQARDDLRIVVMSATLDPGPVAAFLDDCPIVDVPVRKYPVEVIYDVRSSDRRPADRAADAARRALDREGHVLVFLPGVGEIERTRAALDGADADVLPLHGRLSGDTQDRALRPQARAKIVLATNIAETSVTIDGVRTVIDTGLARVPRFDPAIGLTRLERGPISRASADQRAGRAGRTGPGVCRRLWTLDDHRQRPDAERPEIRRADLARTALELRAWGVDPLTFRWFEAPEPAQLARADALLRMLDAVGDVGITPLGQTLLTLPLDPRVARVVVEGHAAGCLTAAATAAAIITERDIFRAPPDVVADSDLQLRLDALAGCIGDLDARAVGGVRRVRDQLVRVAIGALGRPRRDEVPDTATLHRSLRAGFPDRVAQRRAPRSDRFRLAGGGGARLDPRSAVRDAPFVLAVAMDAGRRGERAEHVIRIAAAVDPASLPTTRAVETRFDSDRERVVQRRVTRYLDLVLDESHSADATDPTEISQALAAAVALRPQAAFRLNRDVETWLARLRSLAAWMPELDLPTFAELDGPGETTDVLRSLCAGARSFAELRRLDLRHALDGWLTHARRTALARHAPEHFALPSGRRGRLTYDPPNPPVLSATVQAMFGLFETPTVADGRVKVLVHLLAPNQRPVQVTQDLASFWRNTYPQVRKDLRGRYPKHAWPENPLQPR